MLSIATTSKGPVNLTNYTRHSQSVDNGRVVHDFYFADGGRVTLPDSEGQALIDWLNERAVFDTQAATK